MQQQSVIPIIVNPCAEDFLDHSEINHPRQLVHLRSCAHNLGYVPMAMHILALALVSKDAVAGIPFKPP